MSVPLLQDYTLHIWKDRNNDVLQFRETKIEKEEICLFKALRWLGNSQHFKKYFNDTKGLVFDKHEVMKNGLSAITCAYYGCRVDFITSKGSVLSNKTQTNIEANRGVSNLDIHIADDFNLRTRYKLVVLPKLPWTMPPRYVHCYEFLPNMTKSGGLLVFLEAYTNEHDENERAWRQNRSNWLKENNFIMRFHGTSNCIVSSTISGTERCQRPLIVSLTSDTSTDPAPGTSTDTAPSTSTGTTPDTSTGTTPSTISGTRIYQRPLMVSPKSDTASGTSTGTTPSTISGTKRHQRPLVVSPKSDTSTGPWSEKRPLRVLSKSVIDLSTSTDTARGTTTGTTASTSTGLRSDQHPLLICRMLNQMPKLHVYAYEKVGPHYAHARAPGPPITNLDLLDEKMTGRRR